MHRMLILLLLVMSIFVASCGVNAKVVPTQNPIGTSPLAENNNPKPTSADTNANQATIRFAVFDYMRTGYEELIKAFEKSDPEVNIRLVSLDEIIAASGSSSDDLLRRLVSSADVIDFVPPTRDMTRQGLVRDLTPFIQSDANFRPDDFYPNTLTQFQWDGGTWGIPTLIDRLEIIAYDKEAFDKAGVPYPKPGWTWDDFLAKARALTAREGDKVTRWGFVQPLPYHQMFIEGRVRSLIDGQTEPPNPRFNQPDVVSAVRWYVALFGEYKVTPYFEPPQVEGSGTIPQQEGQKLISAGQAAMWRESYTHWMQLKQRSNIGAAPFPVDMPDSRTSPIVQVSTLSMSAGTAHPDAAWRWIRFVSHEVVKTVDPYSKLPARRSVAEANGYWNDIDKELADTLRFALEHSYYAQDAQPGYKSFSNAIDKILKGEQSIEDALAEAQSQAEIEIQDAWAARLKVTPVPPFVVGGSEGQTGDQAVTVKFLLGTDTADVQPYRALARRFHATYPNVTVEVRSSDGPTDIQSLAQASDCFKAYPNLQDQKNSDSVLSLQPFVDVDSSFSMTDFYPMLLLPFTQQGQLWGLPAEAAPYVIEYNKTIFDTSGVSYPKPNWTMDDFLSLATRLTKGSGTAKQYGFVGNAYENIDLALMMERMNASLVDTSVDPAEMRFNSPSTIKALGWYADLYTKYGVKPVFLTDIARIDSSSAFADRDTLIDAGQAAMWIAIGGTPILSPDKRGKINIGVAPLPGIASGAKVPSYMPISGYFIAAGTEARQACWQWITFLTDQSEAVQGVPSRRSVTESNAYRQRVGAERADAYLASLGELSTASISQAFNGQDAWLGPTTVWLARAHGQVLEGTATVEGALLDAQKKADDYRNCIITHNAAADHAQQVQCLKQIDSTIPDFVFDLYK